MPLTGIYTDQLADFFQFDAATNTWTELKTSGFPPSARSSFGFTASGSKLFLYGGTASWDLFSGTGLQLAITLFIRFASLKHRTQVHFLATCSSST